MIRISVVTITYNAAKVVGKTLDSVFSQNYPYVEHLIIDGASTDDTLTIARNYQQQCRSHEVTILSEPDSGLYDAMNKGLARAKGDYIVFLNAGDFFPSPTTLDTVADSVGEGEELPAVLYGDTDIVDSDYRFVRHRRLAPPEKLSWRSFRHGMLVCHQAFYARLDIARHIPYNLRYRHSADVDWCIRVMKEAEHRHLPLRNVNTVVANFLEGGDSAVNHRASLCERFQIMTAHYGLFTTVFMHLWFFLRALLPQRR